MDQLAKRFNAWSIAATDSFTFTSARYRNIVSSVFQAIEGNIFSKEFLDELIQEILNLRAAYLATISDRSALQKRRNELTLEIERLTEMAIKLPDTREIVEKIGARETERKELDRKLATTATPPPALNQQRLREEIQARLADTLGLL